MTYEKLIIIGSGPAGLTAGIYAGRANLAPRIFAGSVPGGLLTQTSEVENFPGFPEGIDGFSLMENMQKQAERFGAKVEYEEVSEVRFQSGRKHYVKLGSGEEIEADAVIVATGASPRWLGLPSENRLRGKGVSACATCDGAFYRGMPVAVAGGGDSALEEATFLTRFASKVYLIHRRNAFRGSQIMQERARANEKIELVMDAVIEEILGEKEVESVRVKNNADGSTRVIECKGFFAALGHVPETAVFKGMLDLDEKGYIKVEGGSARTSCRGVFAAGDCSDPAYRQAINAAASGCRAAMDAEKYLEGVER